MKILTIHGKGFSFDEENTFGPNLTKTLKKYGDVLNGCLPLGENLTYQNWSNVIDEVCQNFKIDDETVIVCHSLGTLFVPKYISEKKLKPLALICIAGGYVVNYKGETEDFFPTIEDMKYCKDNIDKKFFVYSNGDRYFSEDMQREYINLIGADARFISGYGHFGRTEKVTTIPGIDEIMNEILQSKRQKSN